MLPSDRRSEVIKDFFSELQEGPGPDPKNTAINFFFDLADGEQKEPLSIDRLIFQKRRPETVLVELVDQIHGEEMERSLSEISEKRNRGSRGRSKRRHYRPAPFIQPA